MSDFCFSANLVIFQLYHGENRLIFTEMVMRSALYWSNTLTEIFIVLAHWNNSPWIDTLFWFRDNQSLLFLLNDACLAEKQQMAIYILFGLTQSGLELTIYRTRGEHADHHATNAVSII